MTFYMQPHADCKKAELAQLGDGLKGAVKSNEDTMHQAPLFEPDQDLEDPDYDDLPF